MASLGGGREIGFVVGRRRVEGVCGCIEFGRVVGIGAETGDFVKDSKIWKNAVSLSFSPVDFMRLSGWCGVNNFDSLDCGLGYTVVPGAGGLTLDLSANVLLFFDYKTYVSGKLVLSYSI